MTHHESTDHTNHDHSGDQHDDVLYKTQGNPTGDDAHIEELREAPTGGDYTASESEEEKEAREGHGA